MANIKPGSRASHVLIHVFLILGAIVMVFPFFWMLSCSLKTQGQITSIDIVWWPSPMKFDNYIEATRPLPFLKLYYNTIVMVIGRVICALLFSSMAAYGHARLKFPGNNAIFAIVIIQQMVSGRNLHPSAVSDVRRVGHFEHQLRPDLPGSCFCIWYLPASSELCVAAE